MDWHEALGLDPGSALAELDTNRVARTPAPVASSGLRCSACGHLQASAGRCDICGQLLVEPVKSEVANAINVAAALGESAAVSVPERSLIGQMREGHLARALAEKARGRQWEHALAEMDGGGREVDRDGLLGEMMVTG